MSTATIDLCLPLAKYSYAESETVHSSVQWTHYSAAGLCLLVQGTAGGQRELSLHIIERTTVMVRAPQIRAERLFYIVCTTDLQARKVWTLRATSTVPATCGIMLDKLVPC